MNTKDQDMNEWHSQDTVDAYVTRATDPNTGWYEHFVNFPDLCRLIPADTSRLLDFGCGPGDFSYELSDTYEVAGAEIQPMLSAARDRHPDLTFFEWDGMTPPDASWGTFDVVVAKLVFPFIDRLDVVAAHLASILSSHGSVVCSVPHPDTVATRFQLDPHSVARYDDHITGVDLTIHPIYRPKQLYVDLFHKTGYSLTAESEPSVSADLLTRFNADPEKYKQPRRLNLRLTKNA